MQNVNYENLYKSKNLYPIGPLNLIRNKNILRFVPKTHKMVLDIGCGRGFLDIELAKLGHSVLGIDFSENAISFANKLADENGYKDRLRFMVGDIFTLNLSQKFDIVICSEVLEHIKDDRLAIKKLSDFVNVNGLLIITVPHSIRQWNIDDKLSGHFRRYYLTDIRKLLEGNKLKIEKLFVWGFPLMRLYRFIYRRTYKTSPEQENLPLGYLPKGNLLRAYDFLSPIILGIFSIDNLFNFTRLGIDLVAVGRKINK